MSKDASLAFRMIMSNQAGRDPSLMDMQMDRSGLTFVEG
jgi:hypothetical protein